MNTPPPPGPQATAERLQALGAPDLLDTLFPPAQCDPAVGAEYVATGFTPDMRRRVS